MVEDERHERLRRERGKALVRDLNESELRAAGAARALALHEAEHQLDRIARLLPVALDGGLTIAEVARLTNVSRPTLYELRGRYGDRDVTLSVLQSIATSGRATTMAITDAIGRPGEEIGAVLAGLIKDDLVVEEFNDDPSDPAMECWLTDRGFDVLEHWKFREEAEDA